MLVQYHVLSWKLFEVFVPHSESLMTVECKARSILGAKYHCHMMSYVVHSVMHLLFCTVDKIYYIYYLFCYLSIYRYIVSSPCKKTTSCTNDMCISRCDLPTPECAARARCQCGCGVNSELSLRVVRCGVRAKEQRISLGNPWTSMSQTDSSLPVF